MKFTAKGRKYEIDKFGVITQMDHRPFEYNENYAAIYDKPEYKRGSEILQALRLGFVLGAHGRKIETLLDVGYGNAAFINFIKDHIPHVWGYDVTGVPLDGAYRMPKMKQEAEVMTYWDVLEHIPDCSFLKDLTCDTICISLPYCHFHTEGLSWFENEYVHLKPDEHIRHFCPWSLEAFMKQYGWKAIAESDHENKIRKAKLKIPCTYETQCGTITGAIETGFSPLQNIISMAFKRI